MKRHSVFYVLQQPFMDESYHIYGDPRWDKRFGSALWAESVHLESIRCSKYPEHQRSGERIGDLEIILPNQDIGDFVWTWYSECLARTHVISALQEKRCTGFDFSPVRIKTETENGKLIRNLPVLNEIVVTGKGGDSDPNSGIKIIYRCPVCHMTVYSSYRNGIIVDESNWDGSDFFTVSGYPKYILVTEKVKNIIIESGFTNCALIQSNELEWKSGIRPEDRYTT